MGINYKKLQDLVSDYLKDGSQEKQIIVFKVFDIFKRAGVLPEDKAFKILIDCLPQNKVSQQYQEEEF